MSEQRNGKVETVRLDKKAQDSIMCCQQETYFKFKTERKKMGNKDGHTHTPSYTHPTPTPMERVTRRQVEWLHYN